MIIIIIIIIPTREAKRGNIIFPPISVCLYGIRQETSLVVDDRFKHEYGVGSGMHFLQKRGDFDF